MTNKRVPHALFLILGYCFLAISLLTGCSWSVEGENFRVNAPASDDSLQNIP